MTVPRMRVLAAFAAAALASGCAPKAVPPPPPPARADLIVLAADPEDGSVGAATVTTPQGSVDLAAGDQGTRVVAGQAPSAPAPVAAADLQRIFGEAMSARPQPPREYLLYFESGGDTLTPASQAVVTEIVEFVRQRLAPDVTVIGHTDTTGEADANFTLGMQRAVLIRDLLVKSGLDALQVDVASHGEADLLVKTPDNTPEEKNRRVEVTVR